MSFDLEGFALNLAEECEKDHRKFISVLNVSFEGLSISSELFHYIRLESFFFDILILSMH